MATEILPLIDSHRRDVLSEVHVGNVWVDTYIKTSDRWLTGSSPGDVRSPGPNAIQTLNWLFDHRLIEHVTRPTDPAIQRVHLTLGGLAVLNNVEPNEAKRKRARR